ncbi:MAG: hypothetical protein ACSHWQ_07595, partial [Spongiibacteraceae bacterium]
ADVQLKFKKQIDVLESKIGEGKAKLSEIADASEDMWDAIKEDLESTWSSIRSSVSDAVDKFKK